MWTFGKWSHAYRTDLCNSVPHIEPCPYRCAIWIRRIYPFVVIRTSLPDSACTRACCVSERRHWVYSRVYSRLRHWTRQAKIRVGLVNSVLGRDELACVAMHQGCDPMTKLSPRALEQHTGKTHQIQRIQKAQYAETHRCAC